MTFSDCERWDARSYFFQQRTMCTLVPFDDLERPILAWSRGEGVSKGQPRPIPRQWGPRASNFFVTTVFDLGDQIRHANTWGRHVSRSRTSILCLKVVGPQYPQFFKNFLHAPMWYVTHQWNSAWWSSCSVQRTWDEIFLRGGRVDVPCPAMTKKLLTFFILIFFYVWFISVRRNGAKFPFPFHVLLVVFIVCQHAIMHAECDIV